MELAFRDAHPVSPSQIETFRMCERKWGLDKLDCVPRPSNKYAQRGTDAHAVLEKWQKDGTGIDLNSDSGKIVSAGLRFLPRPGTHHTEHPFLFRTNIATYRGVKDLKSKGPSPIREIWDHKTSSDFRWIKRPEKLRADPQANIYAMSEIVEAAEKEERIERIEQNWVYYLADSKKPQSRKVQLHVLPNKDTRIPLCPPDVKKEHFGIMYFDELYERWAEIEQTALKILTYRELHAQKKLRGADLPYDVSACDAFGGCPYANKSCVLTVSERIESMEAKLTLAEKMRLAAAEKEPATTDTQGTTPTNGGGGTTKPSQDAAAVADEIVKGARKQLDLPATNPPEQSKGTDPDAPDTKRAAQVSSGDRMEMTARMAESFVSARLFPHDEARTPQKIAKLAVEYADAVLAELAKPRK